MEKIKKFIQKNQNTILTILLVSIIILQVLLHI